MLHITVNWFTQLFELSLKAATLMFGNLTEPKFSLDVGDNPLICDCFINEFRQAIRVHVTKLSCPLRAVRGPLYMFNII